MWADVRPFLKYGAKRRSAKESGKPEIPWLCADAAVILCGRLLGCRFEPGRSAIWVSRPAKITAIQSGRRGAVVGRGCDGTARGAASALEPD
jgi:hypothetical protein